MGLGLDGPVVAVLYEFGVERSEIGGHKGDGPHYHVGRLRRGVVFGKNNYKRRCGINWSISRRLRIRLRRRPRCDRVQRNTQLTEKCNVEP